MRWQIGTVTMIFTSQTFPDDPQVHFMGVVGDVDVYDEPGGTGTVIGMLEGGEGQRVDLGSGCRDDNWCNIAWAGGTAWVWGDFLK